MLKDFTSMFLSILLHTLPLFLFCNGKNLYLNIQNESSHNEKKNNTHNNSKTDGNTYKRSINLKSFKRKEIPIVRYNPQIINNNLNIDSRSIYPNKDISLDDKQISLEINGWSWGEIPKINDNSNEIGKIVFEFVLDEFGDIVNIKTLESNVSQSVEFLYRDVVSKIKFSRLEDNKSIDNTIGKISFVLQYE